MRLPKETAAVARKSDIFRQRTFFLSTCSIVMVDYFFQTVKRKSNCNRQTGQGDSSRSFSCSCYWQEWFPQIYLKYFTKNRRGENYAFHENSSSMYSHGEQETVHSQSPHHCDYLEWRRRREGERERLKIRSRFWLPRIKMRWIPIMLQLNRHSLRLFTINPPL